MSLKLSKAGFSLISNRRTSLLPAMVIAILFLSGCSLPPSLQEAFGTETGKSRQLGERVTKFHKALNWGMPEQALDFVSPELQMSFVGLVTGEDDSGERRVIDIAVKNLDYSAEKNPEEAKVDAVVRYYRVPNMVVETRKTKEIWRYSRLDGGWRFSGIDTDSEKGERSVVVKETPPATIGGFMR